MSDKKQRYRFLASRLPASSKRRIVLLTGARQTGKTTLAQGCYPALNYINLDAPENREAVRSVLSQAWGRDIGAAVIDEAQKEPAVFEKIKYSYDAGDISFQVLLGSSQILLLKKIRESLAGRVDIYELWPLLLSELASERPLPPLAAAVLSCGSLSKLLSGEKGVQLGAAAAAASGAEAYLLRWGGMPGLLDLEPEERGKWLKDYEYTYLERDLGDLARLDDLEPFRKFQRLSALRSAGLLNYTDLARDCGVSVDTARRYLEYLRLSYQVVLLQPYSRNLTSSMVKTPKLYWLDIGLLRQLSGYTGPTVSGELYETMVVSELYKWIKTSGSESEMFFYRTRSGMEMDLLVQTAGGVLGVEVKARNTVASRDIRAMKEVAAALKGEWKGGMVVYLGDKLEKISEPDIWAVPSRRLFT